MLYELLSWKVTFPVTSSHSFQPTGIGLGSLWRGNRCVLPIISEDLEIDFFNKFLKLFILPKNMRISKNSRFFFFQKPIIGNTYIFTKCIDDFKFWISLKSSEEEVFPWVPRNAGLFSITRFLYGWRKIDTNKNIFSKHDLHVLFISFFTKIYI